MGGTRRVLRRNSVCKATEPEEQGTGTNRVRVATGGGGRRAHGLGHSPGAWRLLRESGWAGDRIILEGKEEKGEARMGQRNFAGEIRNV